VLNAQITDTENADILLAQQGEQRAYERIIRRSQNLVSTIALAIVKDVDDSEEIAQQVFVSVWQNLKQLNKPESFLPWLRQTTRYAALNYIRDNKVNSRVDSDEASVLLAQMATIDDTQYEQLSQEQNKRLVAQFIDQLPEESREIILLYYREEQSSKQVAQLLHLTEGAVRKKLSRARGALKSEMVKHLGSAIYSTAPALGFSAMVIGLITPSGPVAASVISGSLSTATVSGKTTSSFWVKILSVLGGSLIGAFVAVLVILWSSKIAISNLPSEDNKQTMKRYRNELIAWVLVWGLFITAAYELTNGWVGPVITYSVFAFGLFMLMLRNMAFLHENVMFEKKDKPKKKTPPLTKALNYMCLVLGIGSGFMGLIIGLIASGRLVF
jgi:RNA polymerase sigma factor (sigma-70 family)